MDVACRTAGRNLTHQEWRRFFPNADYRETCPGAKGGPDGER